MQWALFGIRIEHSQREIGSNFEEYDVKDLVAFFTTLEKAEQYVENSKLKNPKKPWIWQQPKVFKKSSLLGCYHYAEIEEYFEPSVPVDPE